MTLVLILTTGFTFFVGQPNWYELDTSGVVWTIYDSCIVARDNVCLASDQEHEAYDARVDSAADVAAAMAELCREADEACTENIGSD